MVTHAWINAKTGKFAVALGVAAASAATQAVNAYLAEGHGVGMAKGVKPNFEAQALELRDLKEKLQAAQSSLQSAEASILAQQKAIDTRNMLMGVMWFFLGVATPIILKKFFGVGA